MSSLDSRLAQAIADAGGVPLVQDVALARIGYELAVEDAQRKITERAAKFRESKLVADGTARLLGAEAAACAAEVGRLKA